MSEQTTMTTVTMSVAAWRNVYDALSIASAALKDHPEVFGLEYSTRPQVFDLLAPEVWAQGVVGERGE